MNKTEMVESIAAKTGLTKVDSKRALDAFLELVMESVANGDRVQLVGFGTWSATARKAHQRRNPQQPGVVTMIPATNIVKFKVGATFKEAAKQKKPKRKATSARQTQKQDKTKRKQKPVRLRDLLA